MTASLFSLLNGEVLRHSEARRLTRRACAEVAAVAAASGLEWGERSAWEMTREVAELTSGNVCSTLADIRAGRPTEYDSINGEVLRRAEELGVAVPVLHGLDREFKKFTRPSVVTVKVSKVDSIPTFGAALPYLTGSDSSISSGELIGG